MQLLDKIHTVLTTALRVGCFWSYSCSQKKRKFLTKGGIHIIPGLLLGTFILCASLVELTEHDDRVMISWYIEYAHIYMYCYIASTSCVPIINGRHRGTRDESRKHQIQP